MLHDVLFLITVFMVCLSLLLVHKVTVLENDFHNLRRDINLPLKLPRFKQVSWKKARMTKTNECCTAQNAHSRLRMTFKRLKREQGSYRAAPASFLQLTANGSKQPDKRGNIAAIPWTVSVQQGKAISHKENRIVVQEDGYYLVFGQVLYKNPSTVMGHIIQRSGAGAAATSLELLRCLQEMPVKMPTNTCYTAGVVQLHQGDELEMVIPCRPQALISMDADSTFFGVIRLN